MIQQMDRHILSLGLTMLTICYSVKPPYGEATSEK